MSATTASPPQERTPGPVEWARRNLFSTWYNSLLTIVMATAAVLVVRAVVDWLLTFQPEILRTNLALFMVGPYPREQLWRVVVMLVALALGGGVVSGVIGTTARASARSAGREPQTTGAVALMGRVWPLLLVVAIILAFTTTVTPTLVALGAVAAFGVGVAVGRLMPLAAGWWRWLVPVVVVVAGWYYLNAVPWGNWGGLLTNVVVTVLGIALAFPLGLVLALARRSSFPAFRMLSVTWIELIRGVPLITLLLMGQFVIGFFLPDFLRPGNLTRVLIAIVLFESAYIAEVVRGGLQSVPRGQVEAGQAVGMSPWRVTQRIVLPQALRNSIPAMVGQFISLFKDTTLLTIIGITELLGASVAANSQPAFFGQGLHRYTLPFVGLIFWAGSYMMSREAGRLERKLGVGER